MSVHIHFWMYLPLVLTEHACSSRNLIMGGESLVMLAAFLKFLQILSIQGSLKITALSNCCF